MRRLILRMSITLDGFISGPNGENDWVFKTGCPDGAAWVVETLRRAGVHAVGRKSFEQWASFYPTAAIPMAPAMNEIPKVVFTETGAVDTSAAPPSTGRGSWADPYIAHGDIAQEVARLKAEPGGDILAHGGAGFAQALVAKGLVDEYRLVVHPVALGKGVPLFTGLAAPAYLTLVEATPFSSGAVAKVYRPA